MSAAYLTLQGAITALLALMRTSAGADDWKRGRVEHAQRSASQALSDVREVLRDLGVGGL